MKTIEEIRENFEDFSTKVGDHRRNAHKLHRVEEILFLTLCALICGCEGWRDIERYGKIKLEFLRGIFAYDHGIPSDDTIRRFFRCLDAEKFSTCFAPWSKTLDLGDNEHISIDGKVSRHSFDENKDPLPLVSAFASECRLVLAQEKVAHKSNEIGALPKLLDVLDLAGAPVTVDARGTQKEIAYKIREKQAHYVLALKGNQGTLRKDTELLFEDENLLKELNVESYQSVDGSEHSRLEQRTYRVVEAPEVLKNQHHWIDLQTLIEVESTREIKGQISQEKRYYISSASKNAEMLAKAIRSHWAIENSLHWILDVSFRDDDSRIRKGNAPQNIAIIKHRALNLLQKTKEKRDSIKQLRKAAG